LTIWGYATNPANGEHYWKELPSQDYFPFARGNAQSRIWANRQYYASDSNVHWEAWQFMGRRIMERYNELHPSDPITKVGFQSLRWPRSPEGFYAKQSYDFSTKQFWIIAEQRDQ
jgi:hypothetical protein